MIDFLFIYQTIFPTLLKWRELEWYFISIPWNLIQFVFDIVDLQHTYKSVDNKENTYVSLVIFYPRSIVVWADLSLCSIRGYSNFMELNTLFTNCEKVWINCFSSFSCQNGVVGSYALCINKNLSFISVMWAMILCFDSGIFLYKCMLLIICHSL